MPLAGRFPPPMKFMKAGRTVTACLLLQPCRRFPTKRRSLLFSKPATRHFVATASADQGCIAPASRRIIGLTEEKRPQSLREISMPKDTRSPTASDAADDTADGGRANLSRRSLLNRGLAITAAATVAPTFARA